MVLFCLDMWQTYADGVTCVISMRKYFVLSTPSFATSSFFATAVLFILDKKYCSYVVVVCVWKI